MSLRWLAGIFLALLVGGCLPKPTIAPTPTRTPDPSFVQMVESQANNAAGTEKPPALTPTTDIPTPVPATETPPTDIPTVAATTAPAETPGAVTDTPLPPTESATLPEDHYWLARPITGGRDYLDRTYPYGGTAGGAYRPHTGVEFPNSAGTPVVAVGNAVVFYAGTDWEMLFGPELSFYGNLVVIELTDYSYQGQSVYALYGHLSEIDVETGQAVAAGSTLGLVGATGVAAGGAHLHFEVRIGNPNGYFTSTRNPDLWIKPYYGYGTLAGRVVDPNGNYFPNVSLTIKGPDMIRYTWTYAGNENIRDNEWGENFTYGDLPEGWYTVTTRSANRSYSEEVYIRSGETTWLELVFDY